MIGPDSISVSGKLSTEQEILCGVIDALGGDGATLAINNTPVEQLHREIQAHVRWLEDEALERGMIQGVELMAAHCERVKKGLVDRAHARHDRDVEGYEDPPIKCGTFGTSYDAPPAIHAKMDADRAKALDDQLARRRRKRRRSSIP